MERGDHLWHAPQVTRFRRQTPYFLVYWAFSFLDDYHSGVLHVYDEAFCKYRQVFRQAFLRARVGNSRYC